MEEESSDALSLSVVPYQPKEIPIHSGNAAFPNKFILFLLSDLNIPPPNWLRPVGPKLKYAFIKKKT